MQLGTLPELPRGGCVLFWQTLRSHYDGNVRNMLCFPLLEVLPLCAPIVCSHYVIVAMSPVLWYRTLPQTGNVLCVQGDAVFNSGVIRGEEESTAVPSRSDTVMVGTPQPHPSPYPSALPLTLIRAHSCFTQPLCRSRYCV